jgi:hypothetical protein
MDRTICVSMADFGEHSGEQSAGECIAEVNKCTCHETVFREGIKYLGNN